MDNFVEKKLNVEYQMVFLDVVEDTITSLEHDAEYYKLRLGELTEDNTLFRKYEMRVKAYKELKQKIIDSI